jgi:hypothetical protein
VRSQAFYPAELSPAELQIPGITSKIKYLRKFGNKSENILGCISGEKN